MEIASPSHGTTVTDEAEAAQLAIDELTRQGIKHIVVLTHVGYGDDIDLASQLTGADVIIGGHSHTLLGTEEFGSIVDRTPRGEYPQAITRADGKIVCVAQAWDRAHVLGSLDVEFDGDGNVRSCSGEVKAPYKEETLYAEYQDENDTTVKEPLRYGDYDVVRTVLAGMPHFSKIGPGVHDDLDEP